MRILVAGPEHWALIREVRLRSLAEAPEAFCSRLEDEQLTTEDGWRARPARSHIALAMLDLQGAAVADVVPGSAADPASTAVIGTASGKPDPHEPAGSELVGMWVDPQFRRTGAALALIDEIVDWARAGGAASLALWVAEDNDRARALYEKCGFTLTGQREPMRPGTDQVRMRMEL